MIPEIDARPSLRYLHDLLEQCFIGLRNQKIGYATRYTTLCGRGRFAICIERYSRA